MTKINRSQCFTADDKALSGVCIIGFATKVAYSQILGSITDHLTRFGSQLTVRLYASSFFAI